MQYRCSFPYLLKYDFLVGIILSWRKHLITACIFTVSALFFNKAVSVHFTNVKVGFYDYILELYKGIEIYVPNSEKRFTIPGIWILLFLYLFYVVNHYPLTDIHSYGLQILLRSKKRLNWWFSKCLWLIMAVLTYYGIGYFVLLLFSFGTGSIPFQLNHEVNATVTKLDTSNIKIQEIIYVGILLPIVISMAISFMQLIISFLTNSSIAGYIAVIILLVASAYQCHPFLLGNYLMFNRSDLFISDGVSANTGIMISAICIVASIILGAIKIQHYDIVASKNQ